MSSLSYRSHRVTFDVVAFQLHKLVEAEFTQCLPLPRILPTYPRKILHNHQFGNGLPIDMATLTGLG